MGGDRHCLIDGKPETERKETTYLSGKGFRYVTSGDRA